MAPRVALALLPMLAVGLAGFVFVRTESDDGGRFVSSRGGVEVRTSDLEAVVRTAPEPTDTGQGPLGRSVRCVQGGSGGFHNPWRCAIRYASGREVSYRVIVSPDGSYRGSQMQIRVGATTRRLDRGRVVGCCVAFTRR